MSCTASLESPSEVFAFQDEGWETEQITDEKVQKVFLKYFRAFVLDAEKRTNAVATGSLDGLQRGHWLDNSYGLALKERGQTPRYEWLRKRGNLYHGFAPQGFHLVPTQRDTRLFRTGFRISHYILDKGIEPSIGLESLLPLKNKRFYFIDSHEAVEIAWYCTIREIFGKKHFNTYFDPNSPHSLCLDVDLNKTPLLPFIEVEERESLRVGDNCFYRNVPLYRTKHPEGNYSGWHVVCVENTSSAPLHLGFGLPLPEDKDKKGVTEKDIYRLFSQEFNRKPINLRDLVSEKVFQNSVTHSVPYHLSLSEVEAMEITVEQIAKSAQTHPSLVGSTREKERLSAAKLKAHLIALSPMKA